MSATSRSFGDEVVTPLFGVRVPVRRTRWPIREKGSGIAMICTFGDITDVTWWRELSAAGARGHPADGALGRCRGAPPGWESRGRRARAARSYDELRRPRRQQARGEIVELLARVGRSGRRAAADHARGEVLREGRPAARDRHEPAVVHQDDRVPRGAARARARAALAPGVHAGALRELGQRPERRLVRQPPAVLRRAVPGLVPARRGRHASTTRARSSPAEDAAAGRSVDRRARRATPPSSAASRAASPAIPTSWTRGRPRR